VVAGGFDALELLQALIQKIGIDRRFFHSNGGIEIPQRLRAVDAGHNVLSIEQLKVHGIPDGAHLQAVLLTQVFLIGSVILKQDGDRKSSKKQGDDQNIGEKHPDKQPAFYQFAFSKQSLHISTHLRHPVFWQTAKGSFWEK
jgi:hypothetical protein